MYLQLIARIQTHQGHSHRSGVFIVIFKHIQF